MVFLRPLSRWSSMIARQRLGQTSRLSFATRTATVPVTVLSGFLGAGKTTMLNHILASKSVQSRIAVLVNDMAEVNIDADLVKNVDSNVPELVQLENGCICCTLRDDLVAELAELAAAGGIDHIVVESTGVSEPLPVAQTFSAPIESSEARPAALAHLTSLNDVVHLHSLVTVVDCSTFLEHLHSLENLSTLQMATHEADRRPLAFLLADQVQFASVLVLNKLDVVSPQQADKVADLLRHLNPHATIVRTTMCEIGNVDAFLQNRSYDEATFARMPEWAEELARSDAEKPFESEAAEFGIGHFSVRLLGRPFHPERWNKVLRGRPDLFDGILRAKGFFWTTASPDVRIDFSIVGRSASLIVNSTWIEVGRRMITGSNFRLQRRDGSDRAVQDALTRLQAREEKVRRENLWHPLTEDRRHELVFIGDQDVMKEAALREAVEEALVTQEELAAFIATFGSDSQEGKAGTKDSDPFLSVPRCVLI